MASVISKVTELDKQMHLKVKELEDEKAKLPVFLREQHKVLTAKFQSDAKEQLQAKKTKFENDINISKNSAEAELNKAIEDTQKIYEKNKKDWVEEIYSQCIENLLEE